jgi:pimeloyl-ACP methyl ester carboxylesterase
MLITVAVLGVVYLGICGLLYFSQSSYIYYPVARSADTPVFTLQRDDARVVVSTNGLGAGPAVLYFGGNAEDVSQAVELLERAFPQTAIYAMHYRSYGGSTGAPSERALVGDGLALFDRVARTHQSITIVGRSLGSGIAVQIAAKKTIQRLVLITPYNSLSELAAQHFPWFPTSLILRDKFESWRYVPQLRMPTAILVAGNDQIIPNPSSQALARAFPAGVATVVMIREADHNNILDFPEAIAALSDAATSAP